MSNHIFSTAQLNTAEERDFLSRLIQIFKYTLDQQCSVANNIMNTSPAVAPDPYCGQVAMHINITQHQGTQDFYVIFVCAS